MKNKIMKEFLSSEIEIRSREKLEQYIDYCITNNKKERVKNEKSDSMTSYHHILPNKLFPKYSKLKENKWNGTHLLYGEHYYAHWLLTEAIDDYSQLFAFCAMHNKDIKLCRIEEKDLIPKDVFQSKMEERSKKQREWRSKTVLDKDGKNSTISEESVKKRLNTLNKKGWEQFRKAISEGLNVIEENGKSKAVNASLRACKTKLETINEDGLNVFQVAAAKRVTNMRNNINEDGKNSIELASAKMAKTRSKKGEDGLSSFQKGGKKGGETSKNTILENGLTIAQDVARRGIITRGKNAIIKYGSLDEFYKQIRGKGNNGFAKKNKVFDSNDNVIASFDSRIEMIEEFPFLGRLKEGEKAFTSHIFSKITKKGTPGKRYINLQENNLTQYIGFYFLYNQSF